MKRRIKITFTLMPLILCIALIPSVTLADSNSIIKDDIEYYMRTDKSVYTLGETVQMFYRVKNLGNQAVYFGFSTNKQYHFRVKSGGEHIWQMDTAANDIMTHFILQPGRSKKFNEIWNMVNDNGTRGESDDYPVGVGSYQVIGELYLPMPEHHVPVPVSIEIVAPPIEAYVEIEPHTLNLQSKGKWLNCHIWLPEDCNVADIEPNSVILEGEPNDIYAEWIWYNEEQNTVMAKFNRSEVQEILSVGEVELTVTGQLTDGTVFEGTDTIRVIDKGRPIRVNSNSIIKDNIEYYMQTDKRVYNLGENVQMVYRVTNLGHVPVTFDFAIVQQSRFEVSDGTQTVWRWPKLVNPAGSIFTLQPGGSKGYSKDWDMINDNTGVLVVPGNYDVIGALTLRTTHERYVPVSVEIKIIPGKKKT